MCFHRSDPALGRDGVPSVASHDASNRSMATRTRAAALHDARPRSRLAASATVAASPLLAESKAPPAVQRRDRTYRYALLVADLVAALLVVGLGSRGSVGRGPRPAPSSSSGWCPSSTPRAGLYERDERLINKSTLDEAPAIFQAATLTTVARAPAGERAAVDADRSDGVRLHVGRPGRDGPELPRRRPRDRARHDAARALPRGRRPRARPPPGRQAARGGRREGRSSPA